jgi:DNA-binding CsgD family transcriptional regulator
VLLRLRKPECHQPRGRCGPNQGVAAAIVACSGSRAPAQTVGESPRPQNQPPNPSSARFKLAPGLPQTEEELAEQIGRLYRTAGIEPLAPEWKGWLIFVRTAQALTALDQDEALRFLTEGLRAGEPEGWIRSFVDIGPRLSPLLRGAVSQGICPDYAAKLLTIIEMEERRRTQAGVSPRSSPIYALLTERELEVLRLAGAGMSNRQIAGRLFVSLSTVKTHLHNISEKLNATSRTGAVTRARELGLVR